MNGADGRTNKKRDRLPVADHKLRSGSKGLSSGVKGNDEGVSGRNYASRYQSGDLSPELLLQSVGQLVRRDIGMAGQSGIIEAHGQPGSGVETGLQMKTALRKIDVGAIEIGEAAVEVKESDVGLLGRCMLVDEQRR